MKTRMLIALIVFTSTGNAETQADPNIHLAQLEQQTQQEPVVRDEAASKTIAGKWLRKTIGCVGAKPVATTGVTVEFTTDGKKAYVTTTVPGKGQTVYSRLAIVGKERVQFGPSILLKLDGDMDYTDIRPEVNDYQIVRTESELELRIQAPTKRFCSESGRSEIVLVRPLPPLKPMS